MKEHLLGLLAARQKLDIIQDEQIYLQVKVLKILELMILQGIQKLVREIILIHIQHDLIRKFLLDLVANGLNKVGFTNPYTSIKHQWIKGSNARFFRHGHPSRTCQPVAVAFHEILKAIA